MGKVVLCSCVEAIMGHRTTHFVCNIFNDPVCESVLTGCPQCTHPWFTLAWDTVIGDVLCIFISCRLWQWALANFLSQGYIFNSQNWLVSFAMFIGIWIQDLTKPQMLKLCCYHYTQFVVIIVLQARHWTATMLLSQHLTQDYESLHESSSDNHRDQNWLLCYSMCSCSCILTYLCHTYILTILNVNFQHLKQRLAVCV